VRARTFTSAGEILEKRTIEGYYGEEMPVISAFYGVTILMFYFDDRRHRLPHIHAQYGEFEAVISVDDGDVLEGDLPKSKMKLVQAWIEIHKDELLANWQSAVKGQEVSKIEPLK
jgi:hypothetical protein